MKLNENERIDDLELNNLKIIQNKNFFCFGVDSVLLADFAKEIKNGSNILDLGAGNGILELLMSAKVSKSKITGIEVQKKIAELANKNIVFNGLQNRCKVMNINIKEFDEKNKYDAVITNPPYKEMGTGLKNEAESKIIARHEILGNLEDFINIASKALKDLGSLYMVNRPERLIDIFEYSRKYRLEPKVLRIVYSKPNSKPKLVLVKATKYANKYLKVREPLYIYNENGEYSNEIMKMYNK